MVAPETLAEVKVVGIVEGNVSQTTTELTANTPSFKAPTFTVSINPSSDYVDIPLAYSESYQSSPYVLSQ